MPRGCRLATALVVTILLLPCAAPAQAPAPPAEPGLSIGIQIEGLSGLGVPALDELLASTPVRGRARLTTEGERLRLDDIEVELDLAGGHLSASGSVADVSTGAGADLRLRLETAHVPWLPGIERAQGAFAMGARIRAEAGGFLLEDVILQTPRSEVGGTLALTGVEGRRRISGTLRGAALDLDELLPSAPKRDGSVDRMLPDTGIPSPPLAAVDLDLRLEAALVRFGGLVVRDATLTLAAEAARTALSVAGHHAGGRLDARVEVTAGAPPVMEGRIVLEQVSLEEVTRQHGLQDYLDGGPTDVTLVLRGSGTSLHQALVSATGELRMHVGSGRILNTVLHDVGVDLVERMVDLLTPKEDRSAVTNVTCAALHLEVEDGIARIGDELVVLTDKVSLAGSGQLDLRDETLSLGLDIRARKGFSFSPASLAGGAAVTGTLMQPEVRVSAAGLGRTAVTVAGAVVTGGLSLLAQRALAADGTGSCREAAAKVPGKESRPRPARVIEGLFDALGGEGKAPPGTPSPE